MRGTEIMTPTSRELESNLILGIIERSKLDLMSANSEKDITKEHLLNLGYTISEGQKRLVVDSKEDERYVLKMAFDMRAVRDNMNELVITSYIREIVNGLSSLDPKHPKYVEPDTAQLFPESNLISSTPMVIKQERVMRWDETPEFRQFLLDNAGKYRNEQEARLAFVNSKPRLVKDIDYIQLTLTECVAGDVTIFQESENFGFKRINGELRLVILDLGSIVPLIRKNNNREVIYPKCRGCGHNMVYSPILLRDQPSLENIFNFSEFFEGSYTCTNPNCAVHSSNKQRSHELTINERDIKIYDEYTLENNSYLRQIYAFYCFYYIPEEEYYKITNINDYHNSLTNHTGIRLNTSNGNEEATLIRMYQNFKLFQASSDYITYNNELMALINNYETFIVNSFNEVPEYKDPSNLHHFESFITNVSNIVEKNSQNPNISPTAFYLSAMLYLQILEHVSNQRISFVHLASINESYGDLKVVYDTLSNISTNDNTLLATSISNVINM